MRAWRRQGEAPRPRLYWRQNELSFEWLDPAYRENDPSLAYIKGDPNFENLKGDPRYGALLEKMNLPE